MFFDIHTHNPVLSGAKAIRSLTLDEAEELLSVNTDGLFSVGFHPWYIDEKTLDMMGQLEKCVLDDRVVFIGECGLDKHSKAPMKLQLEVFERQIELSEKISKPLIVHCVGCFNELLDVRKRINPSQLWVIHGFRGKAPLAEQVLRSGCSLSFGEYFNEDSVRVTPLDKFFVETDESELPIDDIYHKIAQIKGCQPDELLAGEQLYQQITAGKNS